MEEVKVEEKTEVPVPPTKSPISSGWNKLALAQKVSLVVLGIFIIMLPIGIVASLSQTNLRQRAAENPLTPPVSPPGVSTPTPQLSPTPTNNPNPSITPTGVPRTIPVITTDTLPAGKINKWYQQNITGTDVGTNENLTMKVIDGLPPGLWLGVNICQQTVVNEKKQIQCPVRGYPTQTGSFKIGVSLKDNYGNVGRRTINLTIN